MPVILMCYPIMSGNFTLRSSQLLMLSPVVDGHQNRPQQTRQEAPHQCVKPINNSVRMYYLTTQQPTETIYSNSTKQTHAHTHNIKHKPDTHTKNTRRYAQISKHAHTQATQQTHTHTYTITRTEGYLEGFFSNHGLVCAV